MSKVKRYASDNFEIFRQLMYNVHGITYPKSIFDRRLNLLTKKELKRFSKEIDNLLDDIDQRFASRVEEINNIMANRAEIAQDNWK